MPYLIDGYNLLHAMGVLQGRVGPQGLEKARLRLLGLLCTVHGAEASAVTVVFDAHGARPGVADEQEYQGIHIRFAVNHPEADDLIELLIQRDPAPRHLTVVSDDHRLQQAARRKQCTALGCMDYLDEMERRRRPGPRRHPEPADEKTQAVSAQETLDWLREFADLENDPALKELFDPYGFGTEEEPDQPA